MQVVTLEMVKTILLITHTAQDARLTYLINIAEGEILDHIGIPDMDAFYAVFGESEVDRAALQQAVIYVTDQRFQGKALSVKTDPHVLRTLIKYQPPNVTSGSTD